MRARRATKRTMAVLGVNCSVNPSTASATTVKLPALTLWQSFCLASFAKCLATLLTYPLVRVKVLMIAASKAKCATDYPPSARLCGDSHITTLPKNKDCGALLPISGCTSQPQSLGIVEVVQHLYLAQGIPGFFSGCAPQLLNTVLKGAILLVSKEQIEGAVYHALHTMRKR